MISHHPHLPASILQIPIQGSSAATMRSRPTNFRELVSCFTMARDALDYQVSVIEDDQRVIIELQLPGFKKSEIDITLVDRKLSIRATRYPTAAPSLQSSNRIGDHAVIVERTLGLPVLVNRDAISAKFEQHALRIEIPL